MEIKSTDWLTGEERIFLKQLLRRCQNLWAHQIIFKTNNVTRNTLGGHSAAELWGSKSCDSGEFLSSSSWLNPLKTTKTIHEV